MSCRSASMLARSRRCTLRLAFGVLCVLTGWSSRPATADPAYPTKPIRIVLGFATGGPTDILSRVLADQLSRSLGTTVIVENRLGAGGNIAAGVVARSSPDGYTLLVGGTNYVIGRTWYKDIQFDLQKDFRVVATISGNPNVLVVNPKADWRTLPELIKDARAKPGQLSFASSGAGTVVHLAAEMFKSKESLSLRHVPYNGAAPAELDLMAGRVSMLFDSLTVALPFIRDGKMRAIGVTSKTRSGFAPEIPTLAEQGLADYDVASWYAMWAPAKVPDAIVVRLNAAINDALKSPDVKARLDNLQAEALFGSSEAASAFVSAELDKWTKAVALLGPRPD